MEKKHIALIAGGDSDEYAVSMASAATIRKHIDAGRYTVHQIVMRGKSWLYHADDDQTHPVDRNDFSVPLADRRLCFDGVFITIHGAPGEDGRLQGYFDLLGIPYTTSGVLASALTFNKYYCYQLVKGFGVATPPSLLLDRSKDYSVSAIVAGLGLPLFVKPNEGGSSIGMSLVRREEELVPALELAFRHDRRVLLDTYLDGVELTCGVLSRMGQVLALPVTEIISKTKATFFDYEAKYTPGAADEITPARISPGLTKTVQNVSADLYKKLGMKGLVRFDYIACADALYFLEVNVTPGMTETSIVPQQAAVLGISKKELFTILIEEALAGR